MKQRTIRCERGEGFVPMLVAMALAVALVLAAFKILAPHVTDGVDRLGEVFDTATDLTVPTF